MVPFDFSVPCEVFGRARDTLGRLLYSVRVCGPTRYIDAGPVGLRLRWTLEALEDAETIVVPGTVTPFAPLSKRVTVALRAAAKRGARIATICSGSCILAATGLLDGARATTHWLASSELARRFSKIDVDPNVLYIDNGQLLTSAGAAAGLDLCLHMVRRDFGAAVAANAARLSVTPLERSGGQAQFIIHQAPASGTSMDGVLVWIDDHLDQPLALDELARVASMSSRTFSRRFREQTGATPSQWVLRRRVVRAQHLLETTTLSIEEVAGTSGFGAPSALRQRFKHEFQVTPAIYRRTFRKGDEA